MKYYVKPDIFVAHTDFVLMAGLSLKDEEGGDQLTNEMFFDDDTPQPSNYAVWDDEL